MGDTKNLQNIEAIKKIQALAEEIDICMFCTYEDGKLRARPMSTQKADDQGNIWFLSDKDSDTNRQIALHREVELLYAHGYDKYLVIHGEAEILYDKDIIKDLWKTHAKIWFTEGVDDPRISVLKVSFENGHYWDTKNGKVVQLAKMAASLITGKSMDDGVSGKLR